MWQNPTKLKAFKSQIHREVETESLRVSVLRKPGYRIGVSSNSKLSLQIIGFMPFGFGDSAIVFVVVRLLQFMGRVVTEVSTGIVEDTATAPEGVVADEATLDAEQETKAGEERQRTPLDVIPEVLWLLTQSPQHKFMFLADLEWYFLPPFRHRQFRVFHKDRRLLAR